MGREGGEGGEVGTDPLFNQILVLSIWLAIFYLGWCKLCGRNASLEGKTRWSVGSLKLFRTIEPLNKTRWNALARKKWMRHSKGRDIIFSHATPVCQVTELWKAQLVTMHIVYTHRHGFSSMMLFFFSSPLLFFLSFKWEPVHHNQTLKNGDAASQFQSVISSWINVSNS